MHISNHGDITYQFTEYNDFDSDSDLAARRAIVLVGLPWMFLHVWLNNMEDIDLLILEKVHLHGPIPEHQDSLKTIMP